VPPALEELISEALQKKRELRLESVLAFATRLAPFGTKFAGVSLKAIRGIVAKAAGASGAGAAQTVSSTTGRGSALTGSGESTPRGLARSAGKAGARAVRRRWAAAVGTVAVAGAVTAFLARTTHTPRAHAAATSEALPAVDVAACEATCDATDHRDCCELARLIEKFKRASDEIAPPGRKDPLLAR
jgi:hypothetical protein